ncbi:hypothetical protein BKH46_01335 [Helicobacter sp. 12S02634-8]|uniref:prepilin peptidase n=1 Tax=Helicobacter sp. 12S02634-8 TaxID=1476199 RepID=UPI000BC6D4C0|nr:prepilin peptidase [Helicobacter sp. 12S02634-8]PAF48570.1 hypothetical protein BKH46_01335 [Helicobacter sp. 12S02634-8]
MDWSYLAFSPDNLLYFFLTPHRWDNSVFIVILLGWGIFGLCKLDKPCADGFKTLSFNVLTLVILLALGVVLGGFYKGLFQFWLMGVVTLMVLLALLDAKLLSVPDWINFGVFFLVILGSVFFEGYAWLFSSKFIGGLALAGLFAILRIFGDMIARREVLGEGDIVFVASSGFLFGIQDALIGVFWGCVLGVVWAMILRLKGKKSYQIPLITFIVLGLCVGFFRGL